MEQNNCLLLFNPGPSVFHVASAARRDGAPVVWTWRRSRLGALPPGRNHGDDTIRQAPPLGRRWLIVRS